MCKMVHSLVSLILMCVRLSKFTLCACSPFLISCHPVKWHFYKKGTSHQNIEKKFQNFHSIYCFLPYLSFHQFLIFVVLPNMFCKITLKSHVNGLAVPLTTVFCICQWSWMFIISNMLQTFLKSKLKNNK